MNVLIFGGTGMVGQGARIAGVRQAPFMSAKTLVMTIHYLPAEESDAREVIQMIKESGQVGVPIPGDLRYRAFCQRLVAEAVQKLGGLDIVVCNAGRQQSKVSILDISDADFDATMKTNIYAPFYINKAALPHLSVASYNSLSAPKQSAWLMRRNNMAISTFDALAAPYGDNRSVKPVWAPWRRWPLHFASSSQPSRSTPGARPAWPNAFGIRTQ